MTEQPTPQQPEDNFDRLLARRAEVAAFVNSFESKKVQQKAFEAVVASLGLGNDADASNETPDVAPLPVVDSSPPPANDSKSAAGRDGQDKTRRGKSATKKQFSPKKGLNFAPDGAPALSQFVAEKQPRNMNERNLVACAYLAAHMGLKADVEHVLAVFNAAGWPMPSNPINSLQKTASTTLWIDTKNMADIEVVWKGTTYLDTMPVKPAKKSG